MPRDLTPNEQGILDLIERADRAGSPLTQVQLADRRSLASRGNTNGICRELERRGLIVVERGSRPHLLRRPKSSVRPRPMIELHLPLPTSANDLWQPNGRKGLRRTDAYVQWLNDAGWLAKSQLAKAAKRTIKGPYKISMQAVRPDKRRRDLGNLLKATEDLLVSIRVIEDDSLSELITMRWVTVGEGIYVRVEPAGVE